MKNNKFQHKVLASAIASIYLSLMLSPAYASDTEIYVSHDESAPISPTLMMMFDTSGSMDECITDVDSCSSSDQRKNVLKKAMRQILLGDTTVDPEVLAAPGYIKMGLARYHSTSSKGGYVMYPARPLDALVAINPDGYITAQGQTGNADAVQNSTQNLSATTLVIGSNGTLDNTVGLQFAKVKIPKGATIRRAYIQLKAAQTQSGFSKIRIMAEASDSASEYSAGSTVASRSYLTSATNDIELDDWSTGDIKTLTVTQQVQDIISRSGWCGNLDMAFKIAHVPVSGITATQRTAYSFEGAPTAEDRPTLVVDYTIDPESTNSCILMPRTTVFSLTSNRDDVEWKTENASSTTRAIQVRSGSPAPPLFVNEYTSNATKQNIVGLYFRNITLPANAVIDNAYLNVRAYSSVNNVQAISVTSFNNTNLTEFCTGSSASSCQYGSTLNTWPVNTISGSEATWSPSGNSLTADTPYSIPVTEAVRDVISASGWASGRPIGFKLTHANNTNNSASFYSRNTDSGRAPQLAITWKERVTNLSTFTTARDELVTAVNNLSFPSSTPLGAAYAEASRYLYGLGASTSTSLAMAPYNNGGAPADYDSRVVTDTAANSTTVKYKSPILADDACSANYIFLLTDGEPTQNANVATNTNQIIVGDSCPTSGSTGDVNWACMKKLAEYNVRADNRIGKSIRTSTVILGPLASAIDNMEEIARIGQGTAYTATNTAALVAAISETINNASSSSGTISAPGVAVNQINRISHLDQLYFAVFKPDTRYRWDGNLKRYRLDAQNLQIVDNSSPDPQEAIDPTTGLFKEGTRSFWSEVDDGAQALVGGAASKLPDPNQRNMFTYLGALSSRNAALIPMTLGASNFDNDAKGKMGLSSSTADDIKFKNLINWYKGYAVPDLSTALSNTDVAALSFRKTMGAPLHSQPVLINYGYDAGTSAANTTNPAYQKNYVFFSTLSGTLHGVDSRTGIENFSFIPGEKLSTLESQFNNEARLVPEFGMDSTWTYFREDKDLNGQIGSGDRVYLYGGMRMGGSNYYALNVTSLTEPKLLFAIQGGSTGFTRMGQTWSQPVITKMRIGNSARTVMIFGGGYDNRHETSGQIFTGEDLGNQIYIVDAFTGEKLWSASGTATDAANLTVSDMKFSVASAVKAVDINGDGFTDSIYVGDLGGQVFRVDINKAPASATDLVKRVRLFAKVGQTDGTADTLKQRRFYEAPEVAVFTDITTTPHRKFVTVVLGSGYRSRPLNMQTDDHFFTLFDYDIMRKDLLSLTSEQEARTEATGGLQATITKDLLAQLSLTGASGIDATAGHKGWYFDFTESGEKVLAKASIYKTDVDFVTYLPVRGNTNCSPVVGRSRAYSMCLPYGAICDANQGTSRLVNDNVMSGMSGAPQRLILRTDDSTDPTAEPTFEERTIVGTNVTDDGSSTMTPQIWPTKRWREKTRNPSN